MKNTNNLSLIQDFPFLSEDILVYGKRDEEYVHISSVPSGIACNCVCPICGKKLVAKKGKVRVHHFAHYGDEESSHIGHASALQTQLHIAAKEILASSKAFSIPAISVPTKKSSLELPGRTIPVDNVFLETRLDNIIPDIILESGGKKLLVEIYVTHKVDEEKLSKIRSIGLSCIEIDLSTYRAGISEELLEQILISGNEHKSWVFNAFANQKEREILSSCKELPLRQSEHGPKTTSCPIFSRLDGSDSYAYCLLDCAECQHLVTLGQDFSTVLSSGHIYCNA